jgi:multidrug efflux pump subunit AcrA (membrane-fusion protein)
MNMIQNLDRADADEATLDQPQGSSLRRRLAWAALPVLAIIGGYYWTHSGAPTPMAMPTPVVQVSQPLQRQLMLWDDYVGRFEATRSVEVRPRVSGQITSIHFTDGQIVRAGQPLFTIDARPFQAALAEAQAGVATAQSDLALAKTDLDRALRLVSADAVAQSEVDRLKARVQAANASPASSSTGRSSRPCCRSFITIAGAIAHPLLPIAQYPEIAPPTVTVTAPIPAPRPRRRLDRRRPDRAGDQRRRGTCSTSRRSRPRRARDDHVVFKPGTDVDQAQVLVQNRVAIAEPRLPRMSAAWA